MNAFCLTAPSWTGFGKPTVAPAAKSRSIGQSTPLPSKSKYEAVMFRAIVGSSVKRLFDDYTEEWIAETALASSPGAWRRNPNFKKIVD